MPRTVTPELPKRQSRRIAKAVLNRPLKNYRYGDRIVSGVELPFGVRVVSRNLGMYRTRGTYAVTGGCFEHATKAKLRAHDTVDAALTDAFDRVEFAKAQEQRAQAEFPLGAQVPIRVQERYGAQRETRTATVVGHGRKSRFREDTAPGWVTLEVDGKEYFRSIDSLVRS